MTLEQHTHYVDGSWVTPLGTDRLEVVNPATEEVYGGIPDASAADVDRAVEAARVAFYDGDWRHWTPQARADVLVRVADELAKRNDDMAAVLTSEMGSPISQSRFGQIPVTIELLRYYTEQAGNYAWQTRKPSWDAANKGLDVVVQQEPVGVVGAITPWNGPQICTMMKVAPALLAGCTMVFKPAPEASLNFIGFAEAFEAAGLPPGVLNIVTGGAATGEHLVTHDDVDKVAFTGSVAVGRKIASLCAERLRPVTLELGGKSPALLLEDADVEQAVASLLVPMLFVSGQACNAPTRILAPRSRHAEVVDALVAAMDAIPLGDPTDPATGVGPMTSKAQRERVLGYIEVGKAEGAKVALGGGRPAGFDRGWYVDKTVFTDVDNSMRIAQEEIFGPVCAVIAYDGEDDGVRIANDSRLGLAGSVWTADPEHGFEVASRLRSGSLGVNAHGLDAAAPLAGMRDSGIGCERGIEAIDDYVSPKGILVPS
ncbi:MAG: aldehyde dehydrogenase [Pseudonocardia sp. SCN 72-86]|nr:MAG: aldehyde dehydrogenase [Pseudonocardia sp. SCN 72-86]